MPAGRNFWGVFFQVFAGKKLKVMGLPIFLKFLPWKPPFTRVRPPQREAKMDQLRAERARFESELAAGGSPGVIPETPLGEGGHVPTAAVETTRIDDAPGRNDDSVWDSDEDERPTNPGGAAKTPMPSELLARGASMRARAPGRHIDGAERGGRGGHIDRAAPGGWRGFGRIDPRSVGRRRAGAPRVRRGVFADARASRQTWDGRGHRGAHAGDRQARRRRSRPSSARRS